MSFGLQCISTESKKYCIYLMSHMASFFFIVFLCLMNLAVFHQKLLKVTTIDLYKIATSNFGQNVASDCGVFPSQQRRHRAAHFFLGGFTVWRI